MIAMVPLTTRTRVAIIRGKFHVLKNVPDWSTVTVREVDKLITEASHLEHEDGQVELMDELLDFHSALRAMETLAEEI